MERVVEELERQCREKINSSLRSSEDTEIQQDDSIICDVCRSVSNASYEYHLIYVLFWIAQMKIPILSRTVFEHIIWEISE